MSRTHFLKTHALVITLLVILGLVLGAILALKVVESQIKAVPQEPIGWLGN